MGVLLDLMEVYRDAKSPLLDERTEDKRIVHSHRAKSQLRVSAFGKNVFAPAFAA